MLPSGNLIDMGNFALSKFTTGAPSIKTCAVSPESEMACSTMRTNFLVLTIVSALFNLSKSSLCTMFSHAPHLVVGGGVVLKVGGGADGPILPRFRRLRLFSLRSHLAAHLFILPFK